MGDFIMYALGAIGLWLLMGIIEFLFILWIDHKRR